VQHHALPIFEGRHILSRGEQFWNGSREGTELPEAVAAFVLAVNEGQHAALLKTFAEDALVNDQLTEHRGTAAISAWASSEVIGQALAMRVQRAVTHSEQSVVTAIVDGTFDKRGLPDPLVVTFYFSVRNNQVVQLIVLRNERDD
jgi:hypothetical protein